MTTPGAAPATDRTSSLGVVVTNYDTWPLARRCIEHVLRYGDAIDSILVLDDHSAEPPPADLDPRVRVEVNPENLGLVKSLNRALRTIETDLVVVFDSDAHPLNDFTAPVRQAFAADPDLALAGFATVDEAGRPTASSEPQPDALGLVLGQRLDARRRRLWGRRGDRLLSIYSCAMALRRDAFWELGGFDEAFDWLDLDHDLSIRVHRSRWRLTLLPQAVAFHRGAGAPQATSQRVLRFYKNRWLLLTKHGKLRHPRLVRRLVLARLGLELLALRLGGRLLFGPDAGDKLAGRRQVFRYCGENYRAPARKGVAG